MKLKETLDWAKTVLGLIGAVLWVLIALSLLSSVQSGTALKGITYAPTQNGTIVVHNYDSVVVANGEMFFSVNDSVSESPKLNTTRALLKCIYGNESDKL